MTDGGKLEARQLFLEELAAAPQAGATISASGRTGSYWERTNLDPHSPSVNESAP
jgi:hypothetical protein